MTQTELRFEDSLQDQFERYHYENPHVYDLYKRFAIELLAAGRKRYGIAGITERIRWHTAVTTTDSEFKISNNYRSRYARKLMQEIPELQCMFKLKCLRRI